MVFQIVYRAFQQRVKLLQKVLNVLWAHVGGRNFQKPSIRDGYQPIHLLAKCGVGLTVDVVTDWCICTYFNHKIIQQPARLPVRRIGTGKGLHCGTVALFTSLDSSNGVCNDRLLDAVAQRQPQGVPAVGSLLVELHPRVDLILQPGSGQMGFLCLLIAQDVQIQTATTQGEVGRVVNQPAQVILEMVGRQTQQARRLSLTSGKKCRLQRGTN